ncbi:MAG: SprT family zinc-dependent metalloprotease [Albidovulum sp.]|nr:SprT family zinc-dependent metalloprotease [Albidovulum sp.]
MKSDVRPVVLPGSPPLTIFVRRSAKAKRLSLKILQHSGGRIELSIPNSCSVGTATEFALSKEPWIRNSLKKIPPVCKPQIGSEFPVEGKLLRIAVGNGNAIVRTETELRVPNTADSVAEHILYWGMQLASERTKCAAAKYVERLGGLNPVNRISIKDPVSRWGSCSSKGNLMVSWRLIMAPFDVMEYVVAHEVAHLKVMDHSNCFWATLEEIFPNHVAPDNWLKRNGASLHRYDFSIN